MPFSSQRPDLSFVSKTNNRIITSIEPSAGRDDMRVHSVRARIQTYLPGQEGELCPASSSDHRDSCSSPGWPMSCPTVFAQDSAVATTAAKVSQPPDSKVVIFTTQQDHQDMLKQLGITELRPGAAPTKTQRMEPITLRPKRTRIQRSRSKEQSSGLIRTRSVPTSNCWPRRSKAKSISTSKATRSRGAGRDGLSRFLAQWKKNFFGLNAANFGWGGDTTQNILFACKTASSMASRPG